MPPPDERPQPLPEVTRLAAYGVIRRGRRVLLCRVATGYLGAGLWTLPGGGIEFGEAPAEAAIREVAEETGLVASIDGIPEILSEAGIWEKRSGRVRYHHVRFVYPMVVVGGVEQVEVGGSTDAFAWLDAAEIAALEGNGTAGDLVTWLARRDDAVDAQGVEG
jgi:8-oxo-dGTP diphosphatase